VEHITSQVVAVVEPNLLVLLVLAVLAVVEQEMLVLD
jgi:hypothetical protein